MNTGEYHVNIFQNGGKNICKQWQVASAVVARSTGIVVSYDHSTNVNATSPVVANLVI